MENEANSHIMITRSKQKNMEDIESKDKHLVFERVDSNGNPHVVLGLLPGGPDPVTGDVVRQIPPERILEVEEHLDKIVGLFVNDQA